MVRIAGVLALTLAACSASSSSGPPAPTMCSMSDRHGTYLVHEEYVSGNCGMLPDAIVSLDVPSSGGCTFPSFVWSMGNCRSDVTERCTSPNEVTTLVGYSIQEAQDGSVIRGEESLNIVGAVSCFGTYKTVATRQ